MQRVMVATDGSLGADRALDAAIELAGSKADLIIVHVEQGYFGSNFKSLQQLENASINEILYSASSEILAEAESKATARGVTKIRTHSGLGDAAGFILDLVKEEKPDLIVIGKRGRGRLSGLLIGSVSQKLVSLAPCKVLVVP